MAKHKKKTGQSKNKSKKSGKKGFAQRSVEPAGTGKPIEKKGGWLSMIGKVAKHLGSKTLDGLAMVQPELAPLREMVKAHYGLTSGRSAPLEKWDKVVVRSFEWRTRQLPLPVILSRWD
jgi:hypothetical protein